MTLRPIALVALSSLAGAAAHAQGVSVDGEPEGNARPFTVRDGVEMAYFGDIFDSSPSNSYDDGRVSPDGRFALKITHRGVLPEGVTEGTLWLFDVDAVIEGIEDENILPPPPSALVRMSGAINGYPAGFRDRDNLLLHPQWSDDGRGVYFLGRNGQENRRLYRVDVETRDLVPLSPVDQDVIAFSVRGGRSAYLAGPDIDVDELWRSAGGDIPDVVIGTGTPLIPLLFPNFSPYSNVEPLDLEVWQVREGVAAPLTDEATGTALQVSSNLATADISMSPDGTQAVVAVSSAGAPGTDATGRAYRIVDLDVGSVRSSADPEAEGLSWTPFERRPPADADPLRFDVRESLNEPPVLVATLPETGQSLPVFDPNPQLAEVLLLPVEIFEWEDRHGRAHAGGLIKPAEFDMSRRYALVVQTHGFRRNRFFRVGFSDTATAGRALASRDIVVLQVDEADPNMAEPPIDIERVGLDVYLGAIDRLAADGTIDPERVGISGYSFSGLTTATSIARAPERFAAAVIANADPLTMTGYFSYVDSPLDGQTERFLVGAPPFADGIDAWVETSPSLATDAISAAVLVSAADPMHLLSLWDFYAALRYQGKPVELQYIRSGKHNIAQPLHKVAHQEMMVDWFDFWLNGNEDPDPEKAGRYRRWRDLRRPAP